MSEGEAIPVLPRGKPAFDQDPHRLREITERNLEAAIGREVRTFRRQQGMTVADLAAVTGLSIGMLSKIENGNTSPSLVRPFLPCRPSKFRLLVEAQRSPGASRSGFMARHMLHPASRHSKPASLKTRSNPSCSAWDFT